MDTCLNIYQNGRKQAGFTQEQAAEFLHIDARTLRNYEAGTTPVPDDVADLMVDLYRNELLGYRHARMNPVARRYLPEIQPRTLSEAALNLMCKSGMYMAVQTQMMEVASDGQVGNNEVEAWKKVEDTVGNLIAAAFVLMFAEHDGSAH